MTVVGFARGAKHALKCGQVPAVPTSAAAFCGVVCRGALVLAALPRAALAVCPAGRIPVALAHAREAVFPPGRVPLSLSRARVNPWLNDKFYPIWN